MNSFLGSLTKLTALAMIFACTTVEAVKTPSEQRPTFIFAYDTNEGYPAFVGNGVTIPEERPGTYVELLRLVAKQVDVEFQFVRMPWKRCLESLKAGLVSGINGSYRPTREAIGRYPRNPDGEVDVTRRITSDSYHLYRRHTTQVHFDPRSGRLKQAKRPIVAPLGYSIVEDLRAGGNQIDEYDVGLAALLRLLTLQRVDGVIAHRRQAQHTLQQLPHSNRIEETTPAIAEKAYYILISHQFYQANPQLSERIWTAIGELRKTSLPDIQGRYYSLR